MNDDQTTDTAGEIEMPAYGSPLYKLRSRLNGLFGALCGQGNELSDEMRAAMAYLDEHVTPEVTERATENQRLKSDVRNQHAVIVGLQDRRDQLALQRRILWDLLKEQTRIRKSLEREAGQHAIAFREARAQVAEKDAEIRALKENLVVERDGWKDITSALSAQEADAKREVKRLHGVLLVADMLISRLHEPLTTGETGHPGEPSRRTRWIPQRRVDELWQTIVAWRDSWAPAPKDPQSGDNPCGEGCRPGLHGPLCSETESFRPEEEHDCAVCEISAELAEERIAHQATSEELAQLKADMRIRQGALADVLGVPRHDDPTSYYANIEAVADLRRRDLDRTRPAPAEEPGETLRAWPKTPDDPANLDAVQEGQQ